MLVHYLLFDSFLSRSVTSFFHIALLLRIIIPKGDFCKLSDLRFYLYYHHKLREMLLNFSLEILTCVCGLLVEHHSWVEP